MDSDALPTPMLEAEYLHAIEVVADTFWKSGGLSMQEVAERVIQAVWDDIEITKARLIDEIISWLEVVIDAGGIEESRMASLRATATLIKLWFAEGSEEWCQRAHVAERQVGELRAEIAILRREMRDGIAI